MINLAEDSIMEAQDRRKAGKMPGTSKTPAMNRTMKTTTERIVLLFFLLSLICHGPVLADDLAGDRTFIPQIDGAWWQVAGDPDLGEYTSPKQQPVDFGIWQAADGTWQLWSCIRHTKCGGNTRLFYRWEGQKLTDADWKPMGIAMEADPRMGEARGGLQAPHVIKEHGKYHMFRNQRYGPTNLNTQYRSPDPLDFGVDSDEYLIGTLPVAAPEIVFHDGQYYIAALLPSLKGIRVAKLKWKPVEAE